MSLVRRKFRRLINAYLYCLCVYNASVTLLAQRLLHPNILSSACQSYVASKTSLQKKGTACQHRFHFFGLILSMRGAVLLLNSCRPRPEPSSFSFQLADSMPYVIPRIPAPNNKPETTKAVPWGSSTPWLTYIRMSSKLTAKRLYNDLLKVTALHIMVDLL